MLELSDIAKIEKNKLEGPGVWLTLLRIHLVDDTEFRLVANTDSIDWNGQTWTAFPFELDVVTSSAHGELPQLVARVSNVTRLLHKYLERGEGGIGATVTLYVVHSQHLDLTTPELEESFDVIGSVPDSQWITFTLGAPNPLLTRFPRHHYLCDHCRWIYRSTSCRYDGPMPTCDRTLADCRAHSNVFRFGGFPGIPGGAVYRV